MYTYYPIISASSQNKICSFALIGLSCALYLFFSLHTFYYLVSLEFCTVFVLNNNTGWLGGVTVRASNLRSSGHGHDSRLCYQAT